MTRAFQVRNHADMPGKRTIQKVLAFLKRSSSLNVENVELDAGPVAALPLDLGE
jgi:hypothetical protein